MDRIPISPLADPRGKNDFEAGLLFFAEVARMYPGVTWEDLAAGRFQPMAGWWTDLKKATTSVVKGVGGIVSDTVGLVGRVGGSTVRLAADPKVADTVSRAATAYATGGTSEGAKGVFDAIASIFTPTGQQVVSAAGAEYKAQMGMSPWLLGGLALGGGLVLALLFGRRA